MRRTEARDKTRWLKVLAGLPEEPVQFQATISGDVQPSVSPAPQLPMSLASKDTCTHVHIDIDMQTQTSTHD